MMSWRRRIGSVLLILGLAGAAWETFYVFRTGGHWHTDLVTWFLFLGLGWWFHSGPITKGRWRRAIGISLAMVGAVGTILSLKIAAVGVSHAPLVGSLMMLGLAAWLLRSAAHANRRETPEFVRTNKHTREELVVGIEAGHKAQYPKVILPRRIKADVGDSLVSMLIILVPVFTISALGGVLPAGLHPLSMVGIGGGLLYIVFRDSCGKGTSLGKRWLGLRIVDLQTGVPCSGRRVWARNLFDLIPILNTVDFILMCLDSRGQKLMDKTLKIQVAETPEMSPVRQP